ncbi:hypothetical protein [Mastigocoleus testarum]|uniref:hypothetical protein n=1 Tax=Mastigocoleus testarum TaxID=996925 RepID=UPI0004291702|nr:hypothetical protein [Mastigocoleus testarum]
MAIVRYPWAEMTSLQLQLDRMFEDVQASVLSNNVLCHSSWIGVVVQLLHNLKLLTLKPI